MTDYRKIMHKMQSALSEIKDESTLSSQIKLNIKKVINDCNTGIKAQSKKKSMAEKFAEEAKTEQQKWWDSIRKGLNKIPQSDIKDSDEEK